MTSVSSSLPAGLTAAQPTGATGGNTQLDQSSFLKLMTAQLKFQDPFDPVDNSQMVAQMAQFSSVAGISEMNASLKAISAGFDTSRLSDASSFLGRSVLAPSNTAVSDSWGQYAGEFTLGTASSNVSVEYYDSEGTMVHSQSLGARDAGQVQFGFASVDSEGQPVDIGPVTVKVTGAVATDLSTWLPVAAVQAGPSGTEPVLVTSGGKIPVSEVKSVG